MSTSHKWAEQLKQTAEYLLARADIELGTTPTLFIPCWTREDLTQRVRTFLPGDKKIDDYDVSFHPTNTVLKIYASRKVACRLVKPAEYECAPLLLPEEEKQLDAPIPIDAPGAQAIRFDLRREREGKQE
jgi:hypothetical protein